MRVLSRAAVVAITTMIVAACGPSREIVPAPGTQPAPELAGGITATNAGVRVSAAAERWTGEPENLGLEITPMLVRIENNSNERIAIRYQYFEFMHPDGENFEAIPPFNIDETIAQPIAVPRYAMTRFYVAPHLRRFYRRLTPFWDPFYYDPLWYGSRFTVWQRVELPTPDMVGLALPEGVLEPGGVVMGFVYFDHVPHRDDRFTLNLNLITPAAEKLGKVEIPFETK